MALPAHMYIEGETNGEIKGSCDMAGREDSMLIEGSIHGIRIPFEAASGFPTGKRIHGPLGVTKHWDAASPMLYDAACSGEHLQVRIELWRPNPSGDGTEEQFFTIELEQAIVVGIKAWVHECRLPAVAMRPELEQIKFTYKSVTWTFTDGGVMGYDSWLVPGA